MAGAAHFFYCWPDRQPFQSGQSCHPVIQTIIPFSVTSVLLCVSALEFRPAHDDALPVQRREYSYCLKKIPVRDMAVEQPAYFHGRFRVERFGDAVSERGARKGEKKMEVEPGLVEPVQFADQRQGLAPIFPALARHAEQDVHERFKPGLARGLDGQQDLAHRMGPSHQLQHPLAPALRADDHLGVRRVPPEHF
jgi:hypothetical protein